MDDEAKIFSVSQFEYLHRLHFGVNSPLIRHNIDCCWTDSRVASDRTGGENRKRY